METASLVVPTTEILPITCHRQEIQNRTDSSVTFGPATEDEHGASNTTVTIEGSTRSIQNAYVQLVDVLSQSDQLFKYECSPYSSELLADWGTRELFLFQKKFDVFIVCDDSGGYALKAWNESNISDARAELREMFSDSNTSVSDVSSSDSEGSDDLSTSSDDSDNCAMSHMMKIKVSGSPSVSRNRIERIQKKTGATIDISITGRKSNRRTVFTVQSSTVEKTEAAVEKLSVLLNLKTPDFDGDTRKDSSYQKTSDKNNNNYHQTNIKLPPVMNILVLGETGVGKSTFINGLVNYLKCGSIEEALQRGVEILIPSSFTLTDDNYETREIVNRATVDDGEELPNEHLGGGQSATQDPKSYVFSWNDEEGEKKIRIIDTPGIGDTRGLDQDKLNFDKILSFIAGFSELHAVCILIKPNTARLTLAFRFCIDELLVHLHKSASENILFCFTNTRGTLYKPGDTLPTLREHLSKLKTQRNIDIPTNKHLLD